MSDRPLTDHERLLLAILASYGDQIAPEAELLATFDRELEQAGGDPVLALWRRQQ